MPESTIESLASLRLSLRLKLNVLLIACSVQFDMSRVVWLFLMPIECKSLSLSAVGFLLWIGPLSEEARLSLTRRYGSQRKPPPTEVSPDTRFDGPNRLFPSSYLSVVAAGKIKSVADVSFTRRPIFALFSLRRMSLACVPSAVAAGRVI